MNQLSEVIKMKEKTMICSSTGRGNKGTFQASASSVSGVRKPEKERLGSRGLSARRISERRKSESKW
jgi:hypothetical protein